MKQLQVKNRKKTISDDGIITHYKNINNEWVKKRRIDLRTGCKQWWSNNGILIKERFPGSYTKRWSEEGVLIYEESHIGPKIWWHENGKKKKASYSWGTTHWWDENGRLIRSIYSDYGEIRWPWPGFRESSSAVQSRPPPRHDPCLIPVVPPSDR